MKEKLKMAGIQWQYLWSGGNATAIIVANFATKYLKYINLRNSCD